MSDNISSNTKTNRSFYLPKLLGEKGLRPSADSEWFRNSDKGSQILSDVGEDLLVSTTTAPSKGINAIPTVWARPLLFKYILANYGKKPSQRHPLYNQMFGEWIGLLGILAHREINSRVKVTFKEIAIESVNDKLKDSLVKLAPQPVVSIDGKEVYPYTKIILIYLSDASKPVDKGVCVGGLSPETLVYTGSSYQSKLALKMQNGLSPFVKDGLFVEPDKTNFKDERHQLAEWLSDDHLQKFIKGKFEGTFLIDIINKGFVSDFESPDSEAVKPGTTVHGADELILNDHPLYRALLTPLVRDENHDPLEKSDWRIFKDNTPTDVVLVCKDYYENPSSYAVVQGKTPAMLEINDVKSFTESFKQAEGDHIGSHSVKWIRPDLLFFTEELYTADGLVPQRENTLEYPNSNYLLPLNKEILKYCKINDSVEWGTLNPVFNVNGTSVEVTIHFKVLRQNGNAETIAVTKIYTAEKITKLENAVVAIFPDFPHEAWKHYSIFQSLPDSAMSVEPLYSSIGNRTISSVKLEAEKEQFSLKAVPKIVTVLGDNAYPDALGLTNAGGNIIGLVPLHKCTKHGMAPNQISYGIDFGTSNTNIFRKTANDSDDGNSWNIPFNTFCRVAIVSENSEKVHNILKKMFVPETNITLPMPSTHRKSTSKDNTDLVSGNFPYFAEFDFTLPTNIHVDLKWDTQDETEKLRVEYFTGLLYLIMIDLLSSGSEKAEIKFSYPKSFSDDFTKLLAQNWRKGFEKILHKENGYISLEAFENEFKINGASVKGIDNFSEIVEKNAHFHTEGKSAGVFFDKVCGADKNEAFIGIDIGGGTTDISIWAANTILEDSSLKLAGRQLTSVIQKMSGLWPELFRNIPEQKEIIQVLGSRDKDESAFAQVFSILISKMEDQKKLRDVLEVYGEKQVGQQFKQRLCLEFGAIAFYCGLVSAVISNEGKEKEASPAKVKFSEVYSKGAVKLYWGGNGSKFLQWTNDGMIIKNDSPTANFLQVMFLIAQKHLNFDIAVSDIESKSNQSIRPKCEAAGGLVCEEIITVKESVEKKRSMSAQLDLLSNTSALSDTTVIHGETFILKGGRKIEPGERVSEKDIFDEKTSIIDTIDLSALEFCITTIGRCAEVNGIVKPQTIALPFNDSIKSEIQSKLKKYYSNEALKPVEKQIVEPVFLVAVREYLSLISTISTGAY